MHYSITKIFFQYLFLFLGIGEDLIFIGTVRLNYLVLAEEKLLSLALKSSQHPIIINHGGKYCILEGIFVLLMLYLVLCQIEFLT